MLTPLDSWKGGGRACVGTSSNEGHEQAWTGMKGKSGHKQVKQTWRAQVGIKGKSTCERAQWTTVGVKSVSKGEQAWVSTVQAGMKGTSGYEGSKWQIDRQTLLSVHSACAYLYPPTPLYPLTHLCPPAPLYPLTQLCPCIRATWWNFHYVICYLLKIGMAIKYTADM